MLNCIFVLLCALIKTCKAFGFLLKKGSFMDYNQDIHFISAQHYLDNLQPNLLYIYTKRKICEFVCLWGQTLALLIQFNSSNTDKVPGLSGWLTIGKMCVWILFLKQPIVLRICVLYSWNFWISGIFVCVFVKKSLFEYHDTVCQPK